MRGWRRWPASSLALADHVSGPLTRTKSGTGGRHDARHRGRRHSEGLVPPSGRLPTPTPRREFRAACAPGSWVRSGDGPRRFTSHTRRIVMRTARATPANAPRTMCTPLTGCIHDGPPPAVATDQRRERASRSDSNTVHGSSPLGVTDCQQTSPQRLPTGAVSAGEERWTSSRRARGRNDEWRPSAAGENLWASARMAQASAAYAPASARLSATVIRRFFARPGHLGGVGHEWRRSDSGGAARQASHCQHHCEERSQPPKPAASGLICRGTPPTRLVCRRWQQGHRTSGQRGHQPKVSPPREATTTGPRAGMT